ncbi:MAG: metal-dependent hydrolase [Moraxellaceae bacterium]|nr:metal-dependent hydrolase [Moraxellaceae bacterium]
MANFNTHLSTGFLVTAVVAIVGYKAGILDNQQLITCTILGTAGGLLPDIDSNNSTPIKIFFNLASIISAFLLVMYWKNELGLLYLLGLWGVVFVSIRLFIFEVFTEITVHRGVIHSVPFMAMLALMLVSFNYYFLQTPSVSSWLYGLFLFLGSMVHLILDEMYSVNLMNMQIKRSFGTAFKFYHHKSAVYFLVVYLLLVILWIFAPPFTDFWQKIADVATWERLWAEMI